MFNDNDSALELIAQTNDATLLQAFMNAQVNQLKAKNERVKQLQRRLDKARVDQHENRKLMKAMVLRYDELLAQGRKPYVDVLGTDPDITLEDDAQDDFGTLSYPKILETQDDATQEIDK